MVDQRELVISSYPFLRYAVKHLVYHLPSPEAHRHNLPPQRLYQRTTHCRLWRRWIALLGEGDPNLNLSKCSSAKHLSRTDWSAGHRLQRVFKSISRLVSGRGVWLATKGNHCQLCTLPEDMAVRLTPKIGPIEESERSSPVKSPRTRTIQRRGKTIMFKTVH